MTTTETSHAYVLFFTSNHAFRAEKLLLREQIPCKLVPVPRQFSSECGVCLRIDPDQAERVKQRLGAAQVEIDSIRNAG